MATTLIVPGRGGSGPDHWQTWFEAQVPESRRVDGIDWDTPAIAAWSGAIVHAIDRSPEPVWLVGHSFGCLASVLAASRRPERVSGAMLVAPADPEFFDDSGLRDWSAEQNILSPSIGRLLPRTTLPIPTLTLLSGNDPWMRLSTGLSWAHRWGGRALLLGQVGHINVESGHGRWPEGLELFRRLRNAHAPLPLGDLDLCAG